MTIDFRSINYVPIVRSRAAELKGFGEFVRKSVSGVLPTIELTRSRRSKKNPGGAVELSIESAREILGATPFIVDLTSLDSLSNAQLATLLDPDNGFKNWVRFVSEHAGPHAIPVVHLTEPFDADNFRHQLNGLILCSGTVALRIPTSFQEAEEALRTAAETIGGNFVVVIDAGFVRQDVSPAVFFGASQLARMALSHGAPLVVPAASSFPSSVAIPGYGGDAEGEFRLIEVELSENVKTSIPGANIAHGDYAAIHPLDFDGMVTAWVPRVDVPLDRSIFYRRRRRNAGGYALAAQEALSDSRYVSLSCWADDNIRLAAAGSPPGRSPSHWIAVRLNFHLTRQAQRLATGRFAALA